MLQPAAAVNKGRRLPRSEGLVDHNLKVPASRHRRVRASLVLRARGRHQGLQPLEAGAERLDDGEHTHTLGLDGADGDDSILGSTKVQNRSESAIGDSTETKRNWSGSSSDLIRSR